jgi:hypothetical protein
VRLAAPDRPLPSSAPTSWPAPSWTCCGTTGYQESGCVRAVVAPNSSSVAAMPLSPMSHTALALVAGHRHSPLHLLFLPPPPVLLVPSGREEKHGWRGQHQTAVVHSPLSAGAI